MNLITKLLAGMLLVLLGACSGQWETNYDEPLSTDVSRSWLVKGVQVVVPDALTTSEQNSFAPNFDIVWHGDPVGDRKAQVTEILRAGISRGASSLRGPVPVTLQVILIRFHAVTPLAVSRAPAAVHDIAYTVQAFNSAGQPVSEQVFIRADIEAFVGTQAIVAAQTGETQKKRITDHLADVTAGWLGIGADPRRSFTSVGR